MSPDQPSPAPPLSRASLVLGLYGAMALVGLVIAAGRGDPDVYRIGEPVAVLESGETKFLVELSRALEWKAKAALLRKATPPQLRSYLRRPA